MLCISDLISKALLDVSFRKFLKSKSINEDQKWNNEILLISIWEEKFYNNKTVANILEEKLSESLKESCFTDYGQLENAIYNLPNLVIKVPDLVDASNWDENNVAPFVYVGTNNLVKNYDVSSDSSGIIIGIHGSGVLDKYISGVPQYFPVVLKASEDFLVLDSELNLTNGSNISSYHDLNISQLSLENLNTEEIVIREEKRVIVHINDLVRELNIQSNKIKEPLQQISCTNGCVYECIPINSRKLIADEVIINNQNTNSIEYEFSSAYRFNSHLILNDNATFLSLTRQMRNNGTADNWKKNLIGTFRLNDLFEVTSNYNIQNRIYDIDKNVVELSEIELSYSVRGFKSIPIDNILLATNIYQGDYIRFASIRILFGLAGDESLIINDDKIRVSDIRQDHVGNYDLFCLNGDKVIGFNSISIKCDL